MYNVNLKMFILKKSNLFQNRVFLKKKANQRLVDFKKM